MIRFKYAIILCMLCSILSLSAQVLSIEVDESKINKALSGKLDSLFLEDQNYRIEIEKLIEENASKNLIDSVASLMKAKDKKNLEIINGIIQEYGWLGPQDVGHNASFALFLVIQHADLATQQKYYPLIKQAEKEGKIVSSHVATLEDRIAVREGREQTYGSQRKYDSKTQRQYVYPLKDVDNLDSLRLSVGLSPMKEYEPGWDVEEYKQYLPTSRRFLKKGF